MLRYDYRPLMQAAFGAVIAGVSRAVTGVIPIWVGTTPSPRQRIYFANHASHGDFILLSACLSPEVRARTRAVAAAEYWRGGPIRRFLAENLLRTVLVERNDTPGKQDPMAAMLDVLDDDESLIIFPEGTRNMSAEPLLRFRSGLYNLAAARPNIELVPCWIENMARVMPKGTFLPVPLLCRVIFGAPVALEPDEDRRLFLDRASQALLDLKPTTNGASK